MLPRFALTLRVVAFALVGALAGTGCDASEQQRSFEDEAFAAPEGLNDDADWRTAPAFATAGVTVEAARPNPFSEGVLTIGIYTGLDGLPGGVSVAVYDPQTRRLRSLFTPPINGAPGREELLTISRAEFGLVGGRGLYRLIILAGGAVVSYGDVQVL